MTLAIHKFSASCRVPPTVRLTPEFIERVARGPFASACARELRMFPAALPAVVRVKHLPLRMQIPSANLDEEKLAKLWAAEFVRVLSPLLTRGTPAQNNVVYAETRTEWIARFISELLSGSAKAKWEYEEFADLFKLGTVDAVCTLLQREPKRIVPVLEILDAERRLDSLLLMFGDFAFEQLFAMIARAQSVRTADLTIDLLIKVGLIAKSPSPGNALLATRARALRLFLLLNKAHPQLKAAGLTPRLVFHALMALDVLVDVTASLPDVMWADHLSPESLTKRGRPLNAAVIQVLQQFCRLADENDSLNPNHELAQLINVIQQLAPEIAVQVQQRTTSQWLSGDCAGLLLLVGLIERSRWPYFVRQTALGRRWGERAITCCFAALGLRVMGCPLESDRLDPGLQVFAGWIDPAWGDSGLLRRFLSETSDEDRAELLTALNLSPPPGENISEDWEKTLDHIANSIVREFAERVRGFRNASPGFIVKTFFRQAGRICIEETRIRVYLQQNPFHIALHISSADEPVESVSWLGNRRLKFELQNLS